MLSPATSTHGISPLRETPPVFLRPAPSDDCLGGEIGLWGDTHDVEVVIPESTTEGARSLSRIPLLFLRQLAADARLRAELETDPVATLARHGIYVAPEQIPSEVRLPGPGRLNETIRAFCTEEDETIELRHMGFLGGLFG